MNAIQYIRQYTVNKLTADQAADMLAEALYHLRCVSGSRNSYSPATTDALHEHGIVLQRDFKVEALHKQAADFIGKHDVP